MTPDDPSRYGRRQRLLKYVDHRNFPKIVGEFLRAHPDFAGVSYTNQRPKDGAVTDLPRIVWSLVRRTPGKGNLERYNRRERPSSRWVNEDGTVSVLRAQWQTCLFQWDVVAEDSDTADDLVWKLEQLLRDRTGDLKRMGAVEVLFDEQVGDALLPQTEDLPTRVLRFQVILEDIRVETHQALQEAVIKVLMPSAEDYEEVVRGATEAVDPDMDLLTETYISEILVVSAASATGIARTDDYVEGVDFEVLYDPETARTYLSWQEGGKQPEAGETYYVRYLHWTSFATVYLPS